MDGKLTISRNNHQAIRIAVEDIASGTQFLEVHVSADALGLALTGLAYQPCTFELQATHVGKERQVKQEVVPYAIPAGQSFRYGSAEERVAKSAALAPFETEGWRGYAADLGNHHKGNSRDGYLVTFTRFVEQRAEELVDANV